MNQALITLQKGLLGTCVVIPDQEYKNLGQTLWMEARMEDVYLFRYGNPIFKQQLDRIASSKETTYFVIRNLDTLNEREQNKYVGLVKDREMSGYVLPDNVIIVFTVESEKTISKIAKELYPFCVVAF